MDLDAVRLFVLAAERLNISAAGRALGLAPAVASARLAKLERTLGAELLRRSTRKVALSLEGQEFLPFARELLAQEVAARAALGQGGHDVAGTLRFAAPSSFAQLYIAPLLPRFLERHPRLSLDLRLSDTRLDPIEGSFDLALRNDAASDSSLKGRKLAEDTRVLCAAPAYLQRHGAPTAPADLAHHRLIAFQDLAPKPLRGTDGAAGLFDPRAADCRLVVDDGQTQKQATLAGAGISVNSLWSVHDALASGALVRVLPDHVVADEAALWLVYPMRHVLSPKVRVFMDFLLATIGKAPPWRDASNA